MHVLVIFIFVTAEYHHNIVGASGVCEPLIQENNTMPADSISKPVNTRIRTRCKEGYLRKAGTSEMYRCTEKYGKLIWINDLKIVCIPDPRIPPDAPRTELNLTTSTTEKIQTICVTIKPKTEATNEGTTNETTTYPTTEPSVNMTSEILSSTRSTSRQNITTGSPPTQSSKPSTTTDSNSGKMADPKPDSTSIIGVAAGIMIVCLVSAAAAAAVLWWRCKRRATNPANEIELDHTNYAACITYIPVPVSEHCSAEPPDMDAAANKSTTDSQTE
ncbi:interleukin-15 receptor subunit alpha isoform X2 [Misgurnus anguillicaudatus]|uniref:interleukin-15 receptor subunit alpha isoform X2 n=1 Tax=Misgurnus anguillicaudatus TaxID=75329 RepID=UPI003CCF3935